MAEPQPSAQEEKKSSREIVFEEIHRLKLERHALELEEQGYTVVTDAIDLDMIKELRRVIIAQSAENSKVD